MPKRTDIHSILIIGSGPIVIGQACEFDYSGSQACKALRSEGIEVVLVNSNPATIMTDPEFAHRTYIEPITPEVVEKIIESIDDYTDPDLKRAWDDEIERRIKEIESGAEKGIPAAQVMKEARHALNETRRLSSARRK